MTVLEARGLEKTYRGRGKSPLRILKGVSFSVEAGSRVAIVGRSGAGKTTLLNILGGLDAPDSGNVFVDGVPLFGGFLAGRRRQRLRARKIGFVFQSYHLLPDLDIVENVLLPSLAAGGIARSGARARALDLLDRVGLSGRVRHMPSELSGGEQQRLALARALMCNPELILADEPTGNLDSLTGAEIMDLLFELSESGTMSLVMVTHSAEAASRCGTVLRLDSGTIAP